MIRFQDKEVEVSLEGNRAEITPTPSMLYMTCFQDMVAEVSLEGNRAEITPTPSMLYMTWFQDKVAEVEASLEGIRAEMGQLEEEEGAVQKDHLEVRMQLEKFETILKENKAKVKHWRKEVSPLCCHQQQCHHCHHCHCHHHHQGWLNW